MSNETADMINKFSLEAIKVLIKEMQGGKSTNENLTTDVIKAIKQGKIRVINVRDEDYDLTSFDELEGAELIKRRAMNLGVYTAEAQYWTGREWEGLVGIKNNTISGFIGTDFIGSGSELQLLEAALTAYNNQNLDTEGFVIDPFRLKVA